MAWIKTVIGLWLAFFGFLTYFNSLDAHSCSLDLGFILDASGSIRRSGFDDEIDFVRDVTRHLTISATRTRVSVMTFASNPTMKIYFKDSSAQSYRRLHDALGQIRFTGGGTYTDKALNLAASAMFNTKYGARSNVPKVLVILSDGKSQSGLTKVRTAAQRLKNNQVNIFSIGVGYGIRRNELAAMASSHINTHVLQVSGAASLRSIVNAVRTRSCKGKNCWELWTVGASEIVYLLTSFYSIILQPIRKALKMPEFVLSEAIYFRMKKLRGAGQVQSVVRTSDKNVSFPATPALLMLIFCRSVL